MTDSDAEELARSVASHPFFTGLDHELARAVSVGASRHRYDVGAWIAHEGSHAGALCLIVHGKVALEVGAADRATITVQTVGPGEVVGWSWLVPPYRWRFDVRAVKPTEVIALDGDVLRDTLADRPAWGFAFLFRFLPVLAERLENTRVQLLDIHAR